MKKTISHVLATGILVAGAPLAHADFEANIGVTSDYIWRGISQTNNEAAVYGGLDYSHDSGFYAGTWASNLGDGGGYELDLYGGYGGEVSDFGYDLGVIAYTYTSSASANFTEVYGSVSFKMLTAGVNYTVSGEANNAAFDDGDVYYYIGASFDLPQDYSIGLTIGQYEFDAPAAAADDYTNYLLTLTKDAGDWGEFSFNVAQADNDIGSVGPVNPNGDDVLFFVSWGKSF